MKDRMMCSGETMCGCVIQPKKEVDGKLVPDGEPIINSAMLNCGRFGAGIKHCLMLRRLVHIIGVKNER